MRASYSHASYSKLYNCSNKPMNASEERLVSDCCTVFFCSSVLLRLFCIINTLHVGVDYLIIYLLCRILGGGGEIFFGGVDILFGGVIATPCTPPPPPPRKSAYACCTNIVLSDTYLSCYSISPSREVPHFNEAQVRGRNQVRSTDIYYDGIAFRFMKRKNLFHSSLQRDQHTV